MKWVKLGLLQAALFVGIGVLAEPRGKRWRPIVGGGTAMGLLWIQYEHARRSGLASAEPATESYGPELTLAGRVR